VVFQGTGFLAWPRGSNQAAKQSVTGTTQAHREAAQFSEVLQISSVKGSFQPLPGAEHRSYRGLLCKHTTNWKRISHYEIPEAMTRGKSCAVHCMQQKDNSAGTFLVGDLLSKAEQPY